MAGLDLHFTYDKLENGGNIDPERRRLRGHKRRCDAADRDRVGSRSGQHHRRDHDRVGVQPVVIGKPSPRVLELSVEHLGLTPAQGVMIGDRLDTDILAGHRAGLLTVLVLTGVSTREDLASAEVMPDLIFTDLPAMLEEIVGNDR